MKQTSHKKSRHRSGAGRRTVLFLIVLLLLTAVIGLRWVQASREPEQEAAAETPVPGTETGEQAGPAEPDGEPVQSGDTGAAESGSGLSEPEPESEPAESGNTVPASPEPVSGNMSSPQPDMQEPESGTPTEQKYTEKTYQLVTDLVYTRRHKGADGEEDIRRLLEELKEEDPALGDLWQGIMEYWAYVSSDFEANTGPLPADLPDDESLCLVVLGFQLLPDGSMAPELQGRCETALACAQQYPHAVLAVTGGGTASGNRKVTEAGVMADWFVSQGIPRERILVEDASLTTDQNAAFTSALLAEREPAVSKVVIISSDYHVALGSMLFTEASLLYGYRNHCPAPYQVVANAGFPTSGSPEYSDPARFGGDIWILADPTY